MTYLSLSAFSVDGLGLGSMEYYCTAALQGCVPIHSVGCTDGGGWKRKKEKKKAGSPKEKERQKRKKTMHKDCFVFLLL